MLYWSFQLSMARFWLLNHENSEDSLGTCNTLVLSWFITVVLPLTPFYMCSFTQPFISKVYVPYIHADVRYCKLSYPNLATVSPCILINVVLSFIHFDFKLVMKLLYWQNIILIAVNPSNRLFKSFLYRKLSIVIIPCINQCSLQYITQNIQLTIV